MKTIKSCKFNIYLNKESVLELDGSETHNVFARPTSPHKQVYSGNHMSVRGQFYSVHSLLPPLCSFQRSNFDCQV